jgi:hypothetical protein
MSFKITFKNMQAKFWSICRSEIEKEAEIDEEGVINKKESN